MREHKHILDQNNNSKPLILIVAPPGNLQIGLQALLTTRLEVDVLVTGNETSAMKVIKRHNPALVILDDNLPKEIVPTIIEAVRTNSPDIACIVMINDEAHRQYLTDEGADLVLLKGIPPARLISIIEDRLSQEDRAEM